MQRGKFHTAVASVEASLPKAESLLVVGTSDIGFWQVLQAKGYPWDPERKAYYRDRSPLSHAEQVTTPTLFVHPENDQRCPIEQSEQFYMALKMMGHIPVEFVRVPGSWHVGNTILGTHGGVVPQVCGNTPRGV
jgi:dipeptidyl aminopeptidase/acylaminoacyl peptidase